jgi:pilus assembly protein CpaB
VNKRLTYVVIFALVVAGAASLILYRVISTQMAANAEKKTVRLLVAAHNLEIGALVKDGDVKMADWGGAVPVGAITKPEDAVGRGIIQPIYEGEPILDSRVAAKGAGAGLAATIPSGMRAVAVRVNDIVGVAGFVIPGSHVDLLIAGTPPNGTAGLGTLTKTLLQNVEVLSAGQNIQKDAEGKPVSVGVVNMLVTPSQAEVLSLASNEARIQLILRNPLDQDKTNTSGTAMAYLFEGKNGEPPGVVDKAAPPPPKVAAKGKAGPKKAAASPPPAPVAAAPPPLIPVKKEPLNVEVITGSQRVDKKFPAEEAKSEGPKE